MRQRADADPLDAAFGDGSNRRQIDAARGLQFDRRIEGVAPRHGFAQLGRTHVVQQHDVGPGRQHRVELLERVHLDLDHHARIAVLFDELPGPDNRFGGGVNGDSPICADRENWDSPEGEVVVLDQHGLVEPAAMVPAAAATHGVFFQPPPAGRGLAGVVDAGVGVGHQIDVLAGQRGDARQTPEQVQQNPFGGEQSARGAFDRADAKALLDRLAVLRFRRPSQPGDCPDFRRQRKWDCPL